MQGFDHCNRPILAEHGLFIRIDPSLSLWPRTDDAVPVVEAGHAAQAGVGGVQVGQAGQPQPGVGVVGEGQGDAVGAGLRDRGSPLGVEGVRGQRGAVHPAGGQGVLVVAPGDLEGGASVFRG